jgi:hypothetical protein
VVDGAAAGVVDGAAGVVVVARGAAAVNGATAVVATVASTFLTKAKAKAEVKAKAASAAVAPAVGKKAKAAETRMMVTGLVGSMEAAPVEGSSKGVAVAGSFVCVGVVFIRV